MREDEKEFIKQLELFRDLNEESIAAIINLGEIVKISSETYLCHENEKIDYFYIVLSGSLGVIKEHQSTHEEFQINQLHAGTCIGEVGIAGQKLRTATIKSLEETSLFRCQINKLRYLVYKKYKDIYPYLPLLRKLDGILIDRLQYMNQEKVAAMQDQITYLTEKLRMSIFMVATISLLCIYSLSVQVLIFLIKQTTNSTNVTLPMMIVLVGVISYISAKTGFGLKDLGITTKNWRQATYESILYTIPILVAFTFIKFLFVEFIPRYSHLPVFDIDPSVVLGLGYIFLIVPIQELLSRGILQGSLNRFLISQHKEWYSIIISNLIFSAFHTFISPIFAFISFLSGLYYGWLYARHKTLLGPWIAHSLTGFWALCILSVLKII